MTLVNIGQFSWNPAYLGDSAKPNLFGANFLFNRDGSRLPEGIDENYLKFAQEAQVATLRYPGGTLSETNLDLANPDSTQANYMNPQSSAPGNTVSLTSFLNLCKSLGASATIVLPTYRFLSETPDATGHRTTYTGEEENLRSYVRFAIERAAEIGVKIEAFEVGNEWFVDNSDIFGFRMSPIEYGRIANYLSAIIQEELDNMIASGTLQASLEPDIVIQVGPGMDKEYFTPSGFRAADDYNGLRVTATELIAKQFTDIDARKAVDGVLMHRYMTGSDQKAGDWVYSPFKNWSNVTSTMPGFRKVDQYVTEWNVSARNTNERGIAQFDSMFEMIREMMLAGVDHANVWAVQQNNRTRMIANTGADGAPYGGLTYGGIAFDIASAQLRDLRVIKSPEEMLGLSVNAFGNANRTVLVLSNRNDGTIDHQLNLAKLAKNTHHITIYHIQEGADGRPTVTVETITSKLLKKPYSLHVSSQESIVVVASSGNAGALIEGYDQNDTLYGSNFADTLLGGDGDDSCRGGDGNDLLIGELGGDWLYGEGGNDTIGGGSGDDLLDGGAGNDFFLLSEGNDTIIGGSGDDTVSFETLGMGIVLDLNSSESIAALLGATTLSGVEAYSGGHYNDVLRGGALDDRLSGGVGDDVLNGGDGNDRLLGEVGNDLIDGGVGNDSLYGGLGNDSIIGGSGRDLLYGGDGADSLDGGIGLDTLYGDLGDDSIFGGIEQDWVSGGAGNDTIYGDIGTDTIYGDDGADYLDGGEGVDSVFGGSGRDFILGEDGGDYLDGGLDVDRIFGGDGADKILGGSGDDFLFGGAGEDSLDGSSGSDILNGEDGNDRLAGGDDVDNAYGGNGDDLIFGGNGRDFLRGDTGNDTIYGDGDRDHIIGGLGNDLLYGGLGDDILVDGAGSDRMYGGTGSDVFVFTGSGGSARVLDFKNNTDTLQFSGTLFSDGMSVRMFVDTYAHRLGNSIVFDFGDKGTLTVTGVNSIQQLYDDVSLVL